MLIRDPSCILFDMAAVLSERSIESIEYYGKFQFDWFDLPFSPGFRLIREIKSRQIFSKLRLAKKLRETRNLIQIYPIEYQTNVDNQSNQSNVKPQSNAIEYYPEIGRSIAIRMRLTMESQLFDRVRLRSIGSIAIFVRSRSIDIVWLFCSFTQA